MARLLVFWTRPAHLSVDEAETWMRGELGAVTAIAAVEHAVLTRLSSASASLPRTCDWMLELELAAGSDREDCVEDGPLVDWLADLRLLGMRPSVVLAEGENVLESRAGR